jgi:arylsulfatase A-like enzyme
MQNIKPAETKHSPTPIKDTIYSRPDSAYYQRYYANGIPTTFASMSIHAGIQQHPRRSIPVQASTQHIPGIGQALRDSGYRTYYAAASDPDSDSQRVWFVRWFDEVDYTPADKERDRTTFRRAAARLRELGRSGQPFFGYLVSMSNHSPFITPEPQLNVTAGKTARDRLRNTMRYTDDVVRELYESLRAEPWFDNTVWIIIGDHGFDIGERGEVALGHNNLRHETTWVPLIIHGADARLPRGRIGCVASHVDLAPTLSDLAGIARPDSYMGHSLITPDCRRHTALILRWGYYAYETQEFSLFKAPGMPALVYAGDDLEQSKELAQPPQDLLARAEELARAMETVVSYAVDFDRHTPSDPDL